MRKKKLFAVFIAVLAISCLLATSAFAAGSGDVASAVESTSSVLTIRVDR